jgi:hypothetical protein
MGDHASHNYSWPWFLFVASFIFPLTVIERMIGYLEGELIPICLGVLIHQVLGLFTGRNSVDRCLPCCLANANHDSLAWRV